MKGKSRRGLGWVLGCAALSVVWSGLAPPAAADEPAHDAAPESGSAEPAPSSDGEASTSPAEDGAAADGLIGDLPIIGYAQAVRHPKLGFDPAGAADVTPELEVHSPEGLDVLAVAGDRVRFRLSNRIATWAAWVDVEALAPLVVSPQAIAFGEDGAEVRVHSGVRVTLDAAAGTARAELEPFDLAWLVDVEVPRSATGPIAEAPIHNEFIRSGSLRLAAGSLVYARPSALGTQLVRIGEDEVAVDPADREARDGFRAIVLVSRGATITGWVMAERVEEGSGGGGSIAGAGYGDAGRSHAVWRYPAVGARIYGAEDGELPVGEVHTSDRLLQGSRGSERTSVALSAGGWTIYGWIANDELFSQPVP